MGNGSKTAKQTDKAKALRHDQEETKPRKSGETPRSSREITSGVVLMTPERAQKLLDNTKIRNRPINEAQVRDLLADIKEGIFWVTHEPIAVDENDNVVDGQHRLTAIARSGVSVRVFFAKYGAGVDIHMDKVNVGKSRRPGDVLEIADIVPRGKGRDMAAMATALWIGLNGVGASPTREQQIRIIETHGDDMLRVLNFSKINRVTSLVRAAFAYALPVNINAVSEFARKVCEKLEVQPNTGAACLNDFMASTRGRMRSTDAEYFVRVLSALQADIQGRPISRLAIKAVGWDNGALQWFASRRRALKLEVAPFPETEHPSAKEKVDEAKETSEA